MPNLLSHLYKAYFLGTCAILCNRAPFCAHVFPVDYLIIIKHTFLQINFELVLVFAWQTNPVANYLIYLQSWTKKLGGRLENSSLYSFEGGENYQLVSRFPKFFHGGHHGKDATF